MSMPLKNTVFSKTLFLLLVLIGISGYLPAQTLREMKTYYDKNHTVIKERYTVIGNDSSRISGEYFKFFRNY